MMNMKVVCALMLMVVLMVEVATIAEAQNCDPNELLPCAGAIIFNSTPSAECCSKLREQTPCFCEYIRDPDYSQYVNSPRAREVASACNVVIPNNC
ncbi:putative bifunctional inhibitor/plant lipid transfer protein/seed storage helical [Medicago truncatula]|uniref:Lipid transfer protein n=1 Tax=Medicago truncatula TaxID=3880 RepID=G7KV68_MEDTR|nr:Lipid transfer protein [Medicago truncatula]RHN47273.1 putative bifunctional inhibitor/plant lipid transfer protein/seed storage helical [Medicago truncatula]